jgi:hypothetical protein
MRCVNPRAGKKTSGLPLGLLTMILVLAQACGTHEDFAPVITDLSRPPTTPWEWDQGFNKGSVVLIGKVHFEDPDGDVVLLHFRWTEYEQELTVKSLDTVLQGLAGTKSGSIPFRLSISTDSRAGEYEVQASLSDGQGNISNTWVEPYKIRPKP